MGDTAMKQESFSVHLQTQDPGVVPDTVTFDSGECLLRLSGLQIEVASMSGFDFTALASEAQLHEIKVISLEEKVLIGDLVYRGVHLQTTSLRWIRPNGALPKKNGDMTILEFQVLEQPLQIERITSLQLSLEVIAEQTQYAQGLAQLPAEFKCLVYELRDWLSQLKLKIDKLETETPADCLKEAQAYRSTIAETVSEYLGKCIPAKYAAVPALMRDLKPEQHEWAIRFARAQVGHLVYGAPFAHRAYFKPRGYAGDFEMMNHLYRNELVGKTLYDQCLHKYFIDEPAGAAVKNRGQFLFEKITDLFKGTSEKQPLKIISVASGPAMEQQLFLKRGALFYGRPVQFTCLDQDEGSLKHAQKQLRSLELSVNSGFDFQFNNMAIKNVIARGLPDEGYDLVYSAGLFDYFTEKVARAAALRMMDALKPGGQLIIGNFSKENPSVPFMELVLDWHLIYRSEQDLLRIFQGLGTKIWVEQEPLGINLFVVIQK